MDGCRDTGVTAIFLFTFVVSLAGLTVSTCFGRISPVTLLDSTGYSWRCTAQRSPALTDLHHRPPSPRHTDGWQQSTNHRARRPSRPHLRCDASLISRLKSLSLILADRPKLTRIIHEFQPVPRGKHTAPWL